MKNDTVVYLVNPWSEAVSTMTWLEVKAWAREHVHQADLDDWLKAARNAVREQNWHIIGAMVIGS